MAFPAQLELVDELSFSSVSQVVQYLVGLADDFEEGGTIPPGITLDWLSFIYVARLFTRTDELAELLLDSELLQRRAGWELLGLWLSLDPTSVAVHVQVAKIMNQGYLRDEAVARLWYALESHSAIKQLHSDNDSATAAVASSGSESLVVSLLRCVPEQIARVMQLSREALLRSITPTDFVDYVLKGENTRIGQAAMHFNAVSLWVQTTCLLAKSAKKRAALVAKWVEVAAVAAVKGWLEIEALIGMTLSSVPLLRLKKTWQHLPPASVRRLQEITEVISPRGNFIQLRHMAAYFGVPLPLFIQTKDATFFWEKLKQIRPAGRDEPFNYSCFQEFGIKLIENDFCRYYAAAVTTPESDDAAFARFLADPRPRLSEDRLYAASCQAEPSTTDKRQPRTVNPLHRQQDKRRTVADSSMSLDMGTAAAVAGMVRVGAGSTLASELHQLRRSLDTLNLEVLVSEPTPLPSPRRLEGLGVGLPLIESAAKSGSSSSLIAPTLSRLSSQSSLLPPDRVDEPPAANTAVDNDSNEDDGEAFAIDTNRQAPPHRLPVESSSDESLPAGVVSPDSLLDEGKADTTRNLPRLSTGAKTSPRLSTGAQISPRLSTSAQTSPRLSSSAETSPQPSSSTQTSPQPSSRSDSNSSAHSSPPLGSYSSPPQTGSSVSFNLEPLNLDATTSADSLPALPRQWRSRPDSRPQCLQSERGMVKSNSCLVVLVDDDSSGEFVSSAPTASSPDRLDSGGPKLLKPPQGLNRVRVRARSPQPAPETLASLERIASSRSLRRQLKEKRRSFSPGVRTQPEPVVEERPVVSAQLVDSLVRELKPKLARQLRKKRTAQQLQGLDGRQLSTLMSQVCQRLAQQLVQQLTDEEAVAAPPTLVRSAEQKGSKLAPTAQVLSLGNSDIEVEHDMHICLTLQDVDKDLFLQAAFKAFLGDHGKLSWWYFHEKCQLLKNADPLLDHVQLSRALWYDYLCAMPRVERVTACVVKQRPLFLEYNTLATLDDCLEVLLPAYQEVEKDLAAWLRQFAVTRYYAEFRKQKSMRRIRQRASTSKTLPNVQADAACTSSLDKLQADQVLLAFYRSYLGTIDALQYLDFFNVHNTFCQCPDEDYRSEAAEIHARYFGLAAGAAPVSEEVIDQLQPPVSATLSHADIQELFRPYASRTAALLDQTMLDFYRSSYYRSYLKRTLG